MRGSVSVDELRGAGPGDPVFQRLVDATLAPVNGELDDADALVNAYEQRYEMTSARMLERVSSGEMVETNDVCTWLMLLKRQKRLVQRKARSH